MSSSTSALVLLSLLVAPGLARAEEEEEKKAPRAAVTVPGFKLIGARPLVAGHTYETNYGDVTLPSNASSKYSRFEMRINLERPGRGYAAKLLWGMWLSTMIGLVAMFVKATEVDP